MGNTPLREQRRRDKFGPTFARCVTKVIAQGHDEGAAFRICFAAGAGGQGLVGKLKARGLKHATAKREARKIRASRESASPLLLGLQSFREAAHLLREQGGAGGRATKREQGHDFPASAYLYVPDPRKPSAWKLRIQEVVGGRAQVTRAQVARAVQAVTVGFRGQKVQGIPPAKLAAIKARLRGIYRANKWDMPPNLKESAARIPLRVDAPQAPSALRDFTEFGGAGDWPAFLDVLRESSVDKKARVIKGVVLLGPESPTRNRRYTPEAIKGAVKLYESAPVYLNHPEEGKEDEDRRVQDLAGRVIPGSVKFVEATGKLVGDVKANTTAAGDTLLEIAASDPGSVGMSHNAAGKERAEGRGPFARKVVEKIVLVRSVDLVTTKPLDLAGSRGTGTTRNLFEGALAALQEGPIGDKLDAEKAQERLRKINFAATDMISAIIHDRDKEPTEKPASLASKKKAILAVLKDWEAELGKAADRKPNAADDVTESGLMIDIRQISREELGAARPDLVNALLQEGAEAVRRNELADETKLRENAEKERDGLKAQLCVRDAKDAIRTELAKDEYKALPEAARKNVEEGLVALAETGEEITEERVRAATGEMLALLKECGAAPAAEPQKPKDPVAALLEGSGGVPATETTTTPMVESPEDALKRAQSAFGALGGLAPEPPKQSEPKKA